MDIKNSFKRRGIRVHDPSLDQLAEKEGLPASPYNVQKATQADIKEPEEQGKEPQDRTRKFGVPFDG